MQGSSLPLSPRQRGVSSLILCLLLLAGSLLFSAFTAAQIPAEPGSETSEDTEPAADQLGRDTPRGSFTGYIDAVAAEDYARAAEYLDLRYLAPEQRRSRGPDIARRLQMALDQRGDVPPAVMLSDDPQGRQDDDLDPRLDRIGTVELEDETLSILLERVEVDDAAIWLVASQSLRALPSVISAPEGFNIDQVLPEPLTDNTWRGVPVGHWIAMVIMGVLVYALSRIAIWSLARLARTLLISRSQGYAAGLVDAFKLPLRLILAVVLFMGAAQLLGIAIVVRQYFGEGIVIVGWLAVLILGWRVVGTIGDVAEKRLTNAGNLGALSAVLFFRRSAKFILIAIGIILVLDVLGFDVTTGLAALGIGGLAVALGAQKTIENLVGSLSLIFDQPVRVGDFCKVGETLGTIEQIGMRSTRIRTIDRTMVVLPNGDFASQKIENFAHRDTFLFNPVLTLRYDTSADQLRYLLVELRSILYAHPRVDPDPARVRLAGLSEKGFNLEVFAYIFARSFDDFMEVREDIYLRFLDVIAAAGTSLALPSQTVYLSRDAGLSESEQQQAEAQVEQWRDAGELQMPHFAEERVEALRRSIDYPPKGSSSAAKAP